MNTENKMVEKTIWLSYDLDPFKGDFNGLYKFLDSVDAKECGSCLAVFKMKFESEDAVINKLKELIRSSVNLNDDDRIYIIYRSGNRVKGKFLFGRRKTNPPWKGYYSEVVVEDEG